MNDRCKELLDQMNRVLDGRLEGTLSLGDPYWGAREEYRQALHSSESEFAPPVPDIDLRIEYKLPSQPFVNIPEDNIEIERLKSEDANNLFGIK